MADPPLLPQGAVMPSAEPPRSVPLAALSPAAASQASPAGSLPFWCYQCSAQVNLTPGAETICPSCGSGFLEEMETADVGSAARQQRRRPQGRHPRRLQVDLERFPPQQLVRILELFGQPIMHGGDVSERRRHRRRRVRERQRDREREREMQANTELEQTTATEGSSRAQPSDGSSQRSAEDCAQTSEQAERCDSPALMERGGAHGQASVNLRPGESYEAQNALGSREGTSGPGASGPSSVPSENARSRSEMEELRDGEGTDEGDIEDEEWDTADEDDDYEVMGDVGGEEEDEDEDDNDEDDDDDDDDDDEDDEEEEEEEEDGEEDDGDENELEDDDEEEEEEEQEEVDAEDENVDEQVREEQGVELVQVNGDGAQSAVVVVEEAGIVSRHDQSADAVRGHAAAAGAMLQRQLQREGSPSGRAAEESAAVSRGRGGGVREEILLTATQRRSRRSRRRPMNESLAVYVQNLMQDLFEQNLSERNFELRFALPATNFIGNPGDYLDARGFEQLLNQLAENDNSRRGAPPAAKAVVSELPTVIISKEDTEMGLAHCAVCKDNVDVGSEVKELPCMHRYHADCIFPWLANRNSCPVCRFELQTDDPDYEEQRRHRRDQGGGEASSQGVNRLQMPHTQESSPAASASNDRRQEASGSRRQEEAAVGGGDGNRERMAVMEIQEEVRRIDGVRRMGRVHDIRDQRVSSSLASTVSFDRPSLDVSVAESTQASISAGGRTGDADIEGTASDLRARLRGGNGASRNGSESLGGGAASQGSVPALQPVQEDGNVDDGRREGGGPGSSSSSSSSGAGSGSSNWTTVRNTLLNVAVGVAFYFIGLHVVGFRDQRRAREGFTTEMGDFMQSRRRSWWQIF